MSPAVKNLIVNILSSILPFDAVKFALPKKFVVYGHLVGDQQHEVAHYYRYPSLQEFDGFIRQFQKLGYRFVSLPEYILEDDQKKILLTFDDGFKVVRETLHPYMLEKKIPYSLFILSDPLRDPDFYIKTIQPKKNSNPERLFLSEAEIVELKSCGVHIGFHTRSHFKIENSESVDNPEMLTQVTIPQEFRYLFSEPLCFAYPYLAPDSFMSFDQLMMKQLNYKFFFDTKGFNEHSGNHFFRISIDSEKELKRKEWLKFVIKRQLISHSVSSLKKMFIL